MDLKADLHIHSIMSGHSFGTVSEISNIAATKNLKIIAITDHGPAITGAPSELYFRCPHMCPQEIAGVQILFGCEANILDFSGKLDLSEDIIAGLDIALAGFHDFTGFTAGSCYENTNAIINMIKRYKALDIIAHIGNPAYPVNYEDIIKCLNDYNVLIEINNRSFLEEKRSARAGSKENCLRVMDLCVKYQVPVVVSSDAHNQYQVGCIALAENILKQIKFPRELIWSDTINHHKLLDFLAKSHSNKRPKELLT